jgi:streptomycin 6-kinase
MKVLPEDLKSRIVSTWGDNGKEWINRFPSILEKCVAQWSLSLDTPMPDASYNYVVSARLKNNEPVILKVGVPNPELETEIEALNYFNGNHCVRLLKSDRQLGALLLQLLSPGKSLVQIKNNAEATEIAGHIMASLPSPVSGSHAFPAVAKWAKAFDRIKKQYGHSSCPLPFAKIDRAEQLFLDLNKSTKQHRLLHGDLHHTNILFDDNAGWIAIDPKGVIGDPAYESARFLHNPIPGFLSMDNPKKITEERIDLLSGMLHEAPERLLAWGFFNTVLAACWHIEAKSDDWKYSIKCSEIFESLMA